MSDSKILDGKCRFCSAKITFWGFITGLTRNAVYVCNDCGHQYKFLPVVVTGGVVFAGLLAFQRFFYSFLIDGLAKSVFFLVIMFSLLLLFSYIIFKRKFK
jgi:DNA-directed RNA polymerase subunit RPC12/RpoP